MKRNILKRIISIILASLICPQSIFAEEIYNDRTNINDEQALTTISIGDIQKNTEKENEITVPINISNNVGLIDLTLSIGYDSEILTLTGTERGEALTTLAFTAPKSIESNSFRLLWDGISADTSNGSIVLLEFTTANNVESVENLIKVTVVSACNGNLEDVKIIIHKRLISLDSKAEEEDRIEQFSSLSLGDAVDITTDQTLNETTNSVQLIEYDVVYYVITYDCLTMDVDFTVHNGNSENVSVLLVASLYENDTLIDVQTESLSISALQSNMGHISIPLPESHGDYCMKLMVCDGPDTLRPIGSIKEIVDLDNYSRYKYIYVTSGANANFNIYMSATTVKGANNDVVYRLKYNPSKMSPVDLCGFTYNEELTVGEIANTNIIVQKVDLLAGEIEYKLNLETGRNTGIVNMIEFKTLCDVVTEEIIYSIQ